MATKIKTTKRTPRHPQWARYEATDRSGHVWCYSAQPGLLSSFWYRTNEYSLVEKIGIVASPKTVRPGTFPPRYTFTDKGMEQFRNNNNVTTPPIRDPMGLFTGILVAVALLASAAFAAYLIVSAIDWAER